jgi:hypothetical protein
MADARGMGYHQSQSDFGGTMTGPVCVDCEQDIELNGLYLFGRSSAALCVDCSRGYSLTRIAVERLRSAAGPTMMGAGFADTPAASTSRLQVTR